MGSVLLRLMMFFCYFLQLEPEVIRFIFFHPHSHLDYKKRFFSVRCVSTWNSLPTTIGVASHLFCFKRLINDSLDEKLYEYVVCSKSLAVLICHKGTIF